MTAERVKSTYLGMGKEYETLLEALDKFNRDFKQHVGVDRAQSTYRGVLPGYWPDMGLD